MSPLIYIVKRSIANIVKGLMKKPAMLALYIILGVFILGSLAFTFMMPANYGRGKPELFGAIISALTVVVYYFSLRQGVEKGSSLFRAPDVNFVFAGPFRPNDALLYGFIKQLGGMLLILFVAVFQIPNLRNNFRMEPYGVWVILLAVAVYALSYPIFGMVIYAYTSKSKTRKRAVSFLVNAALVLTLLAFLYNLYGTRDPMQAFQATFGNEAMKWIPMIGWTRDIAVAAVDGIGPVFWMGLALMGAMIAAFIIILYRLNLDYYEEVLAATEYREAAIAAKREGRNLQFNRKARRRVRQPIFGRGAAALFGKNMLELRRSSFILFFDRTSAIVIISALAFNIMMTSLDRPGMSQDGFRIADYAMVFILSFSVYMLFLLQMQGKWPSELSKHYIFTLPASAPEKLLFITLSDHIKNLFDSLLLFVIAGVIFKSPIATIAVCVFTYTCLGAVFIYADVLSRRLFGSVHSKPLLIFLKLFLTIFIISPGIGFMIAIAMIAHTELPAVIAFGLWAFVAALGVFAIASGIFKNIEASD